MAPELMLVGPWTNDTDDPFAYRCAFSIKDWQAAALNPIGRLGLAWRPDASDASLPDVAMKSRFGNWLLKRFGIDPTSDQRTVNELFRVYLGHPDPQIRLETIDIADNVAMPDHELIEMISLAATDADERVRKAAKDVWITLQRRADHADSTPQQQAEDPKPVKLQPVDRYSTPRKVQMQRASSRSQEQIQASSKDVSRFIAHAGGAIDGHTYTNSIEALERNYANGFRVFELDIIKTSDGHYVAAHDWPNWARQANYQGPLPASLDEFRKHKIWGKYTSMDMEAINAWFGSHSDAVLVTDKIDEPLSFSMQFIDDQRLTMELFSIEAVEEAVNNGVTIAVSEPLLNQITTDKVEWLLERGIEHVDLSRQMLNEHLPLIQALTKAGIRVFVYHVNYTEREDEAFVVCHDFDFVYGMYADQWGFGESMVDFECCFE